MATESFFSNASLAYLASAGAGKDGKTYSIKPNDGTGDFTFSRGSNLAATRVGADGLIEKGRENLLLRSNEFDTTWTVAGSTITDGQSGYDGSNDAWLLSKSSASGNLGQNTTSNGVTTFSVYAKANASPYLRLIIFDGTFATNGAAYFDLQNGALGTTNAIDSSIESVGNNGWYRCSVSFNTSNQRVYIYPAEANSTTGASGSIYIQAAQLEIGLAATDYIESGATTGKAGLLEDEPRFDYSGGATCPSLLLEPSRTNVIEYSEYFEDTTIYDLRSADIVTNYAISPEGVQNATKVIPQNGTTNFRIQTQNTFGVVGNNVLSVFAKYETGGFQYLILATNSAFQTYAFDIQNGTKVGNAGGATIADEDATIELIGNGWYRCSIKSNNTGIADGVIYLSDDGTNANATGDGSKGMLIYGFQGEANASYPTSYIPNHSGGSVTRGADNINNLSIPNTPSLWSCLVDVDFSKTPLVSNENFLSTITTSGVMSWRFFNINGAHAVAPYFESSASYPFNTNVDDNRTDGRVLLRYNGGGSYTYFRSYLGVVTQTTATGLIETDLNQIKFKAADAKWAISQTLVFPTALSDADCITLTT